MSQLTREQFQRAIEYSRAGTNAGLCCGNCSLAERRTEDSLRSGVW